MFRRKRSQSSGVRLRGGDTLAFVGAGTLGTGGFRLRAFFFMYPALP